MGHAAIVANGKIFWAGGESNRSRLNSVEIYDPATASSSFACLSFTGKCRAADYNNYLVFMKNDGGNKFEIYNKITGAWSIGLLPGELTNPNLLTVSNQLYAVSLGKLYKIEF
jgi:hypothetical protein